MAEQKPITILCMSSYFKGEAFLQEAKRQGAGVLLLTEEKLAQEAWPRESIDEVFLMPDLSKLQDVINAISYLYRSQWIDQIIPLDEYDVENVSLLREHLRLPGMGHTATLLFRDKLAMRVRTHEGGILVPPFIHVLNYDRLRDYMSRIAPPWVLKPRTEAGAMGIKKIHDQEELWRWLDTLGDRQSYYVLEQYIPGDVYHVDSIISECEVIFASVQQYGQPPMNVAHGGGVFTTRTLPRDSEDAQALQKLNARVIKTLGMERGVTHAEYIKAHADGRFYFLEIAARVGGAHISDLIEAATGLNLWAEWAKLEITHLRGESYRLPDVRQDYGGLLVSLARQEFPDTSAYNDPEVVWRLNKKQHVGLIVASPDTERVSSLLESYSQRFVNDFLAVAPPKDKPTN
jgi:glutathione synthase/RimK-type ligase-like ATP-grasp enzyme